jgi:hypothetical protein
VGTVALGGFAPLRNTALGRRPPYSARRIASRLVGRALHRRVSSREALVWSLGLRGLYGPMLGLAWARVRWGPPDSALARGLLLGAGVWSLEHLTFPLVRAPTPARTWTLAEQAFLLAQTLLFGLVTEASLSALEPERSRLGRPVAHAPGDEALTLGPSQSWRSLSKTMP